MKQYDLDYLKHCGRRSSLLTVQEAGRIFGYVSMKSKERWEWRHSEIKNPHHLMYRHINVPLKQGFISAGHQGATTGSVEKRGEQTGKHLGQDVTAPVCPSFYDRNNLSAKQKRQRARMSR